MEEGGQVCWHGISHWERPSYWERSSQWGEDEGATAKPPEKSLFLSNSRAFICPPSTQTWIPVHSMKNQDVAFKCCPNQNTAGKMKEGRKGRTTLHPKPKSSWPKFCLCHKGRVNLRINGSGTTVGGCLQPGGCSHLPLHFCLWQLSD